MRLAQAHKNIRQSMKPLPKVFICVSIFVSSVAASLNVGRPKKRIRGTNHVPESEGVGPGGDDNVTGSISQDPLASFTIATNSTCGGSQCVFKSIKSLSAKLVWFLGCSIDSQAIMHTCLSAGATVAPHNQASDVEFKWCSFNGFTLVFTFHPGATPPPYYDYYHFGHTTTQDIVTSSLLKIQQIFGKTPDATVVDSSLWDVAGWWKKSGSPHSWPIPKAEIHTWCSQTVPQFLNFVQAIMPSSRIAFRTPPPVFESCAAGYEYTCQGPEIVDQMYSCLSQSTNTATHLLYGVYHLMDYHNIALSTHQSLGPTAPLRSYYVDTIHPGRELSIAYMTAVLTWVQGLQ
jgi:hypothetical protein